MAIVLDVFVWSWLLITLVAIIIGMFFGGFEYINSMGIPAFAHSRQFARFSYIVSFFFAIGHCSLGLIISLVGICLISPVLKLVRFIVNMHLKAIYDL